MKGVHIGHFGNQPSHPKQNFRKLLNQKLYELSLHEYLVGTPDARTLLHSKQSCSMNPFMKEGEQLEQALVKFRDATSISAPLSLVEEIAAKLPTKAISPISFRFVTAISLGAAAAAVLCTLIMINQEEAAPPPLIEFTTFETSNLFSHP